MIFDLSHFVQSLDLTEVFHRTRKTSYAQFEKASEKFLFCLFFFLPPFSFNQGSACLECSIELENLTMPCPFMSPFLLLCLFGSLSLLTSCSPLFSSFPSFFLFFSPFLLFPLLSPSSFPHLFLLIFFPFPPVYHSS